MPTVLAPESIAAERAHDAAAASAVSAASGGHARRAAALAYEAGDQQRGRAPRVSAKGSGLVADEIIARARAAGVPIHESRELVSLLMQVDLDQHIPPALYVAVAEVLAWVYKLEQRSAPKI
jgi:flagellar biosynthesis protein